MLPAFPEIIHRRNKGATKKPLNHRKYCESIRFYILPFSYLTSSLTIRLAPDVVVALTI